MRGETNIKTLKAPQLWEPWANKITGECGPIYGKQFVNWSEYVEDADQADPGIYRKRPYGINQVQNLINKIKNTPNDRRMIISLWNPAEIEEMALPPCHVVTHCSVENNTYLDLIMMQRSCDIAIGVPYNIASYSLLLKMLADECGLIARNFIHYLNDAHIYTQHIIGLQKQMEREPKVPPRLQLKKKDFWKRVIDDSPEDYDLTYEHHGFIQFELNV